jgi:2-dehydro-3-deoxyphosphogluconate aldolase / (4S)-4-hydroxy-2-oxoglutarate aldolase
MKREEVRARIEEIGIVPAARFRSAEDARFATQAISHGGIPTVEITMTVPGAIELIADLARNSPEVIVGAGTIFDTETASRCLGAGARFLTSPGLDVQLVEFAIKKETVVLAGALTPTEVTLAWKAGADFVKIFPC